MLQGFCSCLRGLLLFMFVTILERLHMLVQNDRCHILILETGDVVIYATRVTGLGTDRIKLFCHLCSCTLCSHVIDEEGYSMPQSFVECMSAHVGRCATVTGASPAHLLGACWRESCAITREHKTGWEVIGANSRSAYLLSVGDTSCPCFWLRVLREVFVSDLTWK